MKRLTQQQKNDLKLSIQEENVLLQRVKRYVQFGSLFAAIAWIFLLTIVKESSLVHTILLIVSIVLTLFALFSIVSYLNGRKHLLKKMNYLDANK